MSKAVLKHATEAQLAILRAYTRSALKALDNGYTINGREYLEHATRYARYLEGQEITKLEEQLKFSQSYQDMTAAELLSAL